MKTVDKKQLLFLGLIIITSIIIRTLNFKTDLNFSHDQGLFASRALEIYQNRELTLLGPPTSFNYDGRYIFQGPAIYYTMVAFLLPTGFDPLISSYIFTIFAALMVIPLYFGTRMLAGRRMAILISLIYSFYPLYISYTRFLWNPNFQLALTPLLILAIGYRRESKYAALFAGAVSGLLLQYHYQFVIAIVLLSMLFYKEKKGLLLFLAGIAVGFSPIILFEFRNNFYNTNTILLFLSQFGKEGGGLAMGFVNKHYFLSLSLLAIAGLVVKYAKKLEKLNLSLIGILFIAFAIYVFAPIKTAGFGMAPDWKYEDELMVYKTIKKQGLKSFNVTNLVYDTKAESTKYFLKKGAVDINYEDYYNNQYLFVVAKDESFINDPAYEVSSFKPNRIVDKWRINQIYKLYLLERLPNQ